MNDTGGIDRPGQGLFGQEMNMLDLIFRYNLSIRRYQTGLPGVDLNSS
jgi:hypothetical protein